MCLKSGAGFLLRLQRLELEEARPDFSPKSSKTFPMSGLRHSTMIPHLAPLAGTSNTVWTGFENTVHLWRTLRCQATKSYLSQREMCQKSRPYNFNSQGTALTMFHIPPSIPHSLFPEYQQRRVHRNPGDEKCGPQLHRWQRESPRDYRWQSCGRTTCSHHRSGGQRPQSLQSLAHPPPISR
jgi:hypothetical protein